MKRLIVIGVFVTALAAVLAMPTAAKDTRGPACANIVFGDAGYFRSPTNDSGVGDAHMTLDEAACAGMSFLLDVYNFQGTGDPLIANVEPTSVVGDTVTFDYTFAAGTAPDDGVCLVVESFWRGHVADRAPDSGCQQVAAQSSGGGEGFS